MISMRSHVTVWALVEFGAEYLQKAKYSLWAPNTPPMADNNIALTTEIRGLTI